jgi:hypothetical protein
MLNEVLKIVWAEKISTYLFSQQSKFQRCDHFQGYMAKPVLRLAKSYLLVHNNIITIKIIFFRNNVLFYSKKNNNHVLSLSAHIEK